MKIASLTAVFMAAVGMAAAAPPPPSQSPAAIQRAADTTEAVANYELVLRACLCSPFSAIQTFEDRILASRSPITLPPLGSFVYLKVANASGRQFEVRAVRTYISGDRSENNHRAPRRALLPSSRPVHATAVSA